MSDSRNTSSPAPESKGLWKHSRVIVVTVIVLGIVVLTGYHYRYHLLWQYASIRPGFADVKSIPSGPMPAIPIPGDWLACEVGCIRFSLPPELAENSTVHKPDGSLATFQDDTRTVIVQTYDAEEFSGLFSCLVMSASTLSPQPQTFTFPRLRQACYQTSADDFRWSMTPGEARWHSFCIATTKSIRIHSDGHTESLFGDDFDGFAHFHGSAVVFHWQCNRRGSGGYMHIIDRGDREDTNWIRAICCSAHCIVESSEGMKSN